MPNESLNILKTTVKIGLDAPVRFLHITDSHISLADECDSERLKRLAAARRANCFETGREDGVTVRLYEKAIDYARKNELFVVCTGDLIENLSGNADVTVKNCTFGRFRGTMRIQTRGTVLIENCSFANPNDNVLFFGDSVYWYESGPVRNVMLENCRFGGAINACPQVTVTKKEPYYHSGIQMENCRFATDIIFKGIQTDRMRFVDNTCDSGKIPTVKLCGCGICEADCTVVRE